MTDRGSRVMAFVFGLHFAVLQCSYFFLVEAFLSSGHQPYFAMSLLWLCGVLVGLTASPQVSLELTTLFGTGAYLIAQGSLRLYPYQNALGNVAYACILVSGIAAGHFIVFIASSRIDRTAALLHENNGFVVGLVAGLLSSTFHGMRLLEIGPALTTVAVLLTRPSRRRAAAPVP